MTYWGFLLRFIVVPIVLLGVVAWNDARRRGELPAHLGGAPAWAIITVHVVVAVAYTTPWDNFLVATGVWWYDEGLVSGPTIGWVPIEEYAFFVLQSVLVGLLLLALARRVAPDPRPVEHYRGIRVGLTAALAAVWVLFVALLLSRWEAITYLAIQMAWALPPLIIQAAFGGDILWRNRRLVGITIAIATLYLAATDGLAIDGGTWTIDPAQSLHILLAGILPLEEFTFFMITSVLLAFGMTLMLARETYARFPAGLRRRLPWRTVPAEGASS